MPGKALVALADCTEVVYFLEQLDRVFLHTAAGWDPAGLVAGWQPTWRPCTRVGGEGLYPGGAAQALICLWSIKTPARSDLVLAERVSEELTGWSCPKIWVWGLSAPKAAALWVFAWTGSQRR